MPAEGSNQVAPPMRNEKEDFFMLQKVFDFLVVTDAESGSYSPTTAGNVALFLVIALLFLAISIFGGSNKKKLDAKQLAFAAVAVALSVITSIFTVFNFPFGGSITLFRMFFICYIGYLYGARTGVLTGIACGLLDLILKPYVVHPVQLLLDYPVAFGCLGLSGVLQNLSWEWPRDIFWEWQGDICAMCSPALFSSPSMQEIKTPGSIPLAIMRRILFRRRLSR